MTEQVPISFGKRRYAIRINFLLASLNYWSNSADMPMNFDEMLSECTETPSGTRALLDRFAQLPTERGRLCHAFAECENTFE